MDPIETLAATLQEAKKVLSSVGADQWTLPSPCAEWDVRGVVNHMTGGALMLAASISGAPFAHVDDYIGDDPIGAFNAASAAALSAIQADPSVLGRTVIMPFGEMPGAVIVGIMANDEFAHAWDVARATGQSTDLHQELSEDRLAAVQEMMTPEFRKPGFFGPEMTAPDGACAADRLAAFLGRTV